MDENRLKAYVKLIQELLNCSSGEEVNLLRNNQDLVDLEFIEVMEQAAEKAEEEGEDNAATFLRDLAAQLKLMFGRAAEMMNPDRGNRTEAYVKLIEAMLLCDRGEDVALILQNNADLVDAGLVQTMAQVAQVMTEKGEKNSAAFLINLAYQLAEAIESK